MEQLRNEIQQIFRDVFNDEQLVLRDDTTAAEIAAWDSLTHINLIIALEKRLGIRFTTPEISRLKEDGQSIRHLLETIRQKRDRPIQP